MGFLMGAYGKLMAGQRMRSIQFRLTTVQSRLRRITREIGEKEKQYQAQERNMKSQMQSQQQALYFSGLTALANQGSPYAQQQLAAFGMAPALDKATWAEAMKNVQAYSDYQSTVTAAQQMAQMQASGAMSMWQNAFEMERDADLQALKDEEESLQLEKDNLETQLKIAQADYDSNKDMEKQGAQNLKPDYTGQGQ